MAQMKTNSNPAWYTNHDLLSKYGKLELLNVLLETEGGKGAKAIIDDKHLGYNFDDIEKAKKTGKSGHNRERTVDIVTVDNRTHLLMLECKFRAITGKSVTLSSLNDKFKDTLLDLQSSVKHRPISPHRLVLCKDSIAKNKIKRMIKQSPKYPVITMTELKIYIE